MVAGAVLAGTFMPARTTAAQRQLETPEGAHAQVAR
jgi:hypothetical protein